MKNLDYEYSMNILASDKDTHADVNLGELNMQNLIHQKDEDILQITKLQKQNEDYSQRMTVGDVNNFLAGVPSQSHRSAATVQTSESHQLTMINLQQEIEKNMLEIELLKQKLHSKNKLLNAKPTVRLKDRASVAADYFARPTLFPFFGGSS